MATRDEVRAAIRGSRGDRTTLGVLVGFDCGCCGRTLLASEYDGGVWTSWADGRTQFASNDHVLVCKACSADPEWQDKLTPNQRAQELAEVIVRLVRDVDYSNATGHCTGTSAEQMVAGNLAVAIRAAVDAERERCRVIVVGAAGERYPILSAKMANAICPGVKW